MRYCVFTDYVRGFGVRRLRCSPASGYTCYVRHVSTIFDKPFTYFSLKFFGRYRQYSLLFSFDKNMLCTFRRFLVVREERRLSFLYLQFYFCILLESFLCLHRVRACLIHFSFFLIIKNIVFKSFHL